ncbi:MAG: helix-turn-helix transcriptional regulator [Chloroflexi bacterium]|nr:helix-turn-helix transcriptional regulator [Chloroflexota bacterium]
MSTKKTQLKELICDKDFRREFVADYVQEMLSAQIKALREHHNWSQEELGDAAEGMKQVQVSRLENPDYSGCTLNSLKRLANAFDLGLVVRFVRFSEFLDQVITQSPTRLLPPNYDEEENQLSFAGITGDSTWSHVYLDPRHEAITLNYDTLLDNFAPIESNPTVSALAWDSNSIETSIKNEKLNTWPGRDTASGDLEFARAA